MPDSNIALAVLTQVIPQLCVIVSPAISQSSEIARSCVAVLLTMSIHMTTAQVLTEKRQVTYVPREADFGEFTSNSNQRNTVLVSHVTS